MASRMVSAMVNVQSVIGYRFKNHQFLQEALRMPSTTFRSNKTAEVDAVEDVWGIRRSRDGIKRLAAVGDSVLKTALLEDWYYRGHPRG